MRADVTSVQITWASAPLNPAVCPAIWSIHSRTCRRISWEIVRVVPSSSADAAIALYVVPEENFPTPRITGSTGEVRRVTSP